MRSTKVTVQISDSIAKRFGFGDQREVTINVNLNDAESGIAFMISQLAYLEEQMYAVPYANIVFETLVPIVTNIPEGAQSVNYRSYDGATVGKFLGAKATDLPLVAAEYQLHNVPLGYGGLAMTYSLDELRAAAMANINLDSDQAVLAYRGAREHQQQVVLFGDASRDMNGLLNHKNVTVANGTVDWDAEDTTPEQIVDEVNKFIGKVWTDSKQYFLPNTLLIPGERYNMLVTKKMNAASDMSILTYLQNNNLYTNRTNQKLDIHPLPHLTAAELAANGVSNSNKDRMVIYERSLLNLKAYMPIAPRFIAPQFRGLNVETNMEYKISGTEFIYPTCAVYVDLV